MTFALVIASFLAWMGISKLFKYMDLRSKYKVGAIFFLKQNSDLHATILEITNSSYVCQMRIVGYNGRVTDKRRPISKKIFEAKYERIL